MKRTVANVVADATNTVLSTQRSDGSFPPGHNGPYEDPETPARNTSHWLVTLSRLCEPAFSDIVSDEDRERYQAAAALAIDYLNSRRPADATIHHRESPGKDQCNGLIGQAWTIEALVTAGSAFNRKELFDTAESIFLTHPFDERANVWQRVEPDGTVLGFDRTFNHQLWFAAAGGELAAHVSGEVDRQVRQFLDQLETLLHVRDNGLIRHLLQPSFSLGEYLSMALDADRRELCRNALLAPVRPPANKRTLWEKAIGYQSFNLYALAMLAEQYPKHSVWTSQPIERVLQYSTSQPFRDALDGNPYGYPYNCAGIELAYALSVFDAVDSEGQRQWLTQQFKRTYDPETGLMERNNPDPQTLTARLYEATRIPDVMVSI